METLEVLRREIKALAFDQYGTIVDMQKGLTEAVTPFLKEKSWDKEPNSFVTWWRRTHFENSMIDALCDRGPYAVSADRTSRCLFRYGPLRHYLHTRGGNLARERDRET
jgi:phosphoglycolate phosphatase-like HAD superfamily hydrolase